jgi:hypothetical protein
LPDGALKMKPSMSTAPGAVLKVDAGKLELTSYAEPKARVPAAGRVLPDFESERLAVSRVGRVGSVLLPPRVTVNRLPWLASTATEAASVSATARVRDPLEGSGLAPDRADRPRPPR